MGKIEDYLDRIICGDCLEVMGDLPDNSIDLVLTDPPYPDQHLEYGQVDIKFLDAFKCRQLVFWSAKADFPLNYTAVHIWDKKTGCASEYERIFERNGSIQYKMFRHYIINSTVAEQYTGDLFTGHPSQKPIDLIVELIQHYSKPNALILDPFLGSGTTAVACKKLNRHYIGIEINPDYCKIAERRLANIPNRLDCYESEPPRNKLDGGASTTKEG